MIITTKEYHLLVEPYAQRTKVPFVRTMASGRNEISSNELDAMYGGCHIIAHLPLNGAPVLEGVPVMVDEKCVSQSHNDLYTGIDDMNGQPILKGAKVKVHDKSGMRFHAPNEGIIVWGKGNYYVEGTYFKYNVFAWKYAIEVLSNPTAASQKKYSEEDIRKAFEAGEEFGFQCGNDSGDLKVTAPNCDAYIQSLKPLPVDFIPDTELDDYIQGDKKSLLLQAFSPHRKLKLNSEGKVMGTYKY
jgi:hypothetical protein